ncbi:hypothetical protein [Pseudomonas sp. NPDC089569]|uniref:hypothetical protein n=1 Tax=Pseudomonas sp. NPDC089569 TaxID=3390722 RepID=UPI003CFE94A9
MSPDQRDFHVEEFRQLKAEISTMLERIASLFKYGLIGSAAIYSWFLTNPLKSEFNDVLVFASLIPPAMVFFFGLLALVTFWQVDVMGQYLLKIEKALGDQSLGWETHMRTTRGYLLPMLLIFYLLLLGSEIGIAIWVHLKFPAL